MPKKEKPNEFTQGMHYTMLGMALRIIKEGMEACITGAPYDPKEIASSIHAIQEMEKQYK